MPKLTYYIYVTPNKLSEKFLIQSYKNLCDLKIVTPEQQNTLNSEEQKIQHVKEKLKFAPVVVSEQTVGSVIAELNLDVNDIKNNIQYKTKKVTSPLKELPVTAKSTEELSKNIINFIEELEKMDKFNNAEERAEFADIQANNVDVGGQTVNQTITKRLYHTKVDMTAIIPVWEEGGTRLESAVAAKTFVNDMRRFFSASEDTNQAMLINQALTRSKRKYIFNELPEGAKTDVEKFCDHIMITYGPNEIENFMIWKNIKQRENESIRSFYFRVINQFYEVKQKEQLSLAALDQDANKADKFELAQAFIDGLRNSRVRSTLKSRMLDMKFSEMPEHAILIERSYDPEETSINLIRSSNTELRSDIDDKLQLTKKELGDQITGLTKQVKELLKVNAVHAANAKRNNAGNRGQSDQNKFKETRSCHYCGKVGHLRNKCFKLKNDKKHNKVRNEDAPQRRTYDKPNNRNQERSRSNNYGRDNDNEKKPKTSGWGDSNQPTWGSQ